MEKEDDSLRKKQQFHEMFGTDLPKSFTASKRYFRQKKSKIEASLELVIDSLFRKQFPINNTNFVIPKPETMFTETPWHITELQKVKRQLNEIKNKLNDYNIAEWHQHTRRRNRAGDVHWRLRKEVDPEFLTQAWCKFYETASSFPLVPLAALEANKLVSIHLCEAPGAFVTSLNHWIKLNAPGIDWDWIATTLNPYYEGNPLSSMINDDRFIISSLNHWCFGTDYTGNLMSLKNMDNLVERSREKGEVLLVTADGSVDCTDDPGEQESIVTPLHFCEAVAAIQLLSEHGSLLLKMFTIFEHDTLCLVYLLSCLFNRVIVNKPATSKEGNSEVYLVCLGYRGPEFSMPYFNVLREHYENRPVRSMFRKSDIPAEFVSQMISCADFFKTSQCDVILRNIESYRSDEGDGNVDFETKRIKHMVASRFMVACGLGRIETESMEVVGKSVLARIHSIILDPRIPDGSYNERKIMASMEPESLLLALRHNVNLIEIQSTTRWFTFAGSLDALHVHCGKPFSKVLSSKFCMGKFLKIRNRAFDLLPKLGIDDPCNKVQAVRDFINELESDSKNYKYLCFTSSIFENNKATLCKIDEKLKGIRNGDSLVLIGYSLLTQLNVGVLYILAHAFQSLGLILTEQFGCVIILKYNLPSESTLQLFKQVHETTIQAEAAGETVLSVIPITKLCATDLYASIVAANHWTIKHYVNTIADCIEQPK